MGLQCCRESREQKNDLSAPLSPLLELMLYYDFCKNIKEKFYIQVAIADLELYYKHWDNFGLVFHPFVELTLPSVKEKIFLNEGNNDKLNMTSSGGSNNTSTLSNNQIDLSTSVLSVINPENKKVFSFEFIKSFSLNKEDIYGLINVKVYNEMWTCNKDGSNNLKNNNYNYNNENNEESLTIIGEAKIPINLIANTKGDKIFCGNMCIIHRGMGVIGHLYMKIEINEKDFDAAETKGNNILENIDKEEENIEKIDLNIDIKYPYENNPVHFYLFDIEKMKKNLTSQMTSEQMENAVSFISEIEKKQEFDEQYIMQTFIDFFEGGNLLLGYELFIYLYKNCKIAANSQKIINFISKEITNKRLLSVVDKIEYNLIFMKPYMLLIYHYLKTFKNIETEPFEKCLINIGKHLLDMKNSFDKEENLDCEFYLLYENMQLIITIYLEIINNDNFEKVYTSCSTIIDNLDNFTCQIIEKFIDHSELIFTLVRLLRKVFRIVTDEVKIEKLPKHIVNDILSIKRNLIKKSNLFPKLQNIIKSYYHYPEMMSNILQIVVNICNDITSSELSELYERLNFDLLSEKFVFYSTKMKYISKDLNQLFLELLDNLSEMPKTTNFEDVDELLDNNNEVDNSAGITEDYNDKMLKITKEIISFYQRTKKYPDFITKASQYIYFHLLVSNIGYNICSVQEFAYMLANSQFYIDSANLLVKFSDYNTSKTFVREAIDKNAKKTSEKEILIMISDTISTIIKIFLKTLLTSMEELKKQCIEVLENNNDTKIICDEKILPEFSSAIIQNCKSNKIDTEEIEHLLDLLKENLKRKEEKKEEKLNINKDIQKQKEIPIKKMINETEEESIKNQENSEEEEEEEENENKSNENQSNKIANNTEENKESEANQTESDKNERTEENEEDEVKETKEEKEENEDDEDKDEDKNEDNESENEDEENDEIELNSKEK